MKGMGGECTRIQEWIPVGCVPPAAVAIGGVSTSHPGTRPPGTRPPTRHPPGTRLPPKNRHPPGTRPLQTRHPPDQTSPRPGTPLPVDRLTPVNILVCPKLSSVGGKNGQCGSSYEVVKSWRKHDNTIKWVCCKNNGRGKAKTVTLQHTPTLSVFTDLIHVSLRAFSFNVDGPLNVQDQSITNLHSLCSVRWMFLRQSVQFYKKDHHFKQ